MEEGLEEDGRFLVADAEPAEVLEPRNGAFDGPAALVAPERAAVLGGVRGRAAPAVRGDHLDALLGQVVVEQVAVVGLVADDALGVPGGEHEVKEALHQPGFVGAGAARGHRDGQAAGVHEHHDFHAFSGLGDAEAVAAAAGLAEGRVDEALVEAVAAALLEERPRVAHDALEDALARPALEEGYF